MAAHPDDRPSGPRLPGVRAGGSARPDGEAPGTDDLRRGVDAWLDAAPPPPADPVRLGPAADDEEVARKILLDQLTGQARSRSELATKLARKGVPDEVSERLLTRFEEVGLVDDAAFARAWVQSRQSGKGLARRALAQELRRKGIDDEVAREALDEVDPDDEVASARVLVRRKLRSVQRVDRTTAMRRLTGMLARKGYGAGVAMQVVREELDAAQHGADDPDELDGLHGLD
ncbi:recombination regulator RecX [Nocardioides sp. WL0053]|uniref:Regulatory protein RecX n=1 Tax=Nocardioides jiangsuensis TaxID=2866161 RepID=A0ABS7RLH0_9ACTN|nr:regulatory protein RecX [Nocardioides jiangsuensis]MBY9075890.1 recombination regulator RecX [Nocardioides jiangsuensis]